MASAEQRPELLAIVGPTASGKSDLALRVAKEFDGEIIAADSRTVYRDMDIGTAKPTKKDRAKIRHWGLDLVEPGSRFTAYQFKKYALETIADIQNRGKLPIIVGGTGLYVDAILLDFRFTADADPGKRQQLEQKSVEELQKMIRARNYPMPLNDRNKRHLARTLETEGLVAKKHSSLRKNALIIGLMPPDEILRGRIATRAEKIFHSGVVDETKQLLKKYRAEKLKQSAGIVYPLCLMVIEGKIGLDEAIERFKTLDWQYSRRQRTWFKRNKFIQWFERPELAYEQIKDLLNK